VSNQFVDRKYIIGGGLVLLVLVFTGRLFHLQIIDKTYRLSATSNVLRYVTHYPARGLVYDRNGELLVFNEAAYDLMINPRQLAPFDTLEFCEILQVTPQQVRDGIQKARAYSLYRPSLFLRQISARNYAIFQEKMYRFPGFFVQPRTLRRYTGNSAAHILGYVGEVDEKTISENPYYSMGDYIGISGVEKTYEEALRGKKGLNIYLVDVHNRIMGPYMDGRYDTMSVAGKDIYLTIDKNLQDYGELLMTNKVGSIVAIEPASGEILAMVSSPGYDPSLLVGRIRSENFQRLNQDTIKPLFNRALMAQYPPGSTFKVINALVGLQEKAVEYHTEYSCFGGYHAPGIRVGCHSHSSPLNLPRAIQNSCNTYFCHVFRNILDDKDFPGVTEAFNNWRAHLLSFGFGNRLGSDFPNELPGNIPEAAYYDRYYGANRWKSLTLISMAIGQGELLITPLQMANMTATIANRGSYHVPHILREFAGDFTIEPVFGEWHHTSIDTSHYDVAIEGMDLAVNGPPGSGSTARIAAIPGIRVCGKTGTAENPHGEDHSIFIAFAPKDDPCIALAVYVENGGFGATYAAPIASLMIEKYMTGKITRGWLEKYILDTNLISRSEKDD
jgi:penicillin-binding protein 2